MPRLYILAPTLLEYWAVRHTLSRGRAHWAGVRLARWQGAREGAIVIVCGLAGALRPGLCPGTILVPTQVGLPDGRILHCDAALVAALSAGARAVGFRPEPGPLLTAPALIVGDARRQWAEKGFVAVDMETGLLAERTLRVATIRVVLDSAEHDISQEWLRPANVLLRPRLWRELFRLCRVAPLYALRAARVLDAGLNVLLPKDNLNNPLPPH